MDTARQGRALPAGRVAGAMKAKDSEPPPSKQPVSAASLFKQHLNGVRKNVSSTMVKGSAVKKPYDTRAKPGSSSPRKGRSDSRKQEELHPLAAAFNDTTKAYRNTLYEHTTQKLDSTLAHLLGQLHNFNNTTTSSPPRTSDPDGSPQKLTVADKADRTAEKLFRRIGSYNVEYTKRGPNGEEHNVEQMLGDGITEFTARHRDRFEELGGLEQKWETVVGEIWKVGVNCLGEDAMSALLLEQPGPSSSSPVRAEDDGLTLDLEPKPARKRVKFQEPVPELPKFLSATSLYLDLPVPGTVSKQDVKALEGRVEALGVKQVEALAQIKVDQDKWWKRKMVAMQAALAE